MGDGSGPDHAQPATAPGGRPRRWSLVAAGLVFGIVIGFVLGECLLRILDLPRPIQIGWRFQGLAAEANDLGFRGRKIAYSPEDFVVVLLGDSQVAATACSFYWMPERRLEEHLQALASRPVKVFSLGHGGYGQDQQLLILREYLRTWRADAVVLWETPNNDVWNNLFPTQNIETAGGPKPTFWLEGDQLRGPTFPKVEGFWVSSKPLRVWALWQTMTCARELTDEDWERRRLPEPYQPLASHVGDIRTDWEDNRRLGGEFCYEQVAREKCHFAMQFTPPSARWQYGLRLTNVLLHEIARTCAARNASLLTFSIPPERLFDDGVYRFDDRLYRVSRHQFDENLRRMNDGIPHEIVPVRTKLPRVGPHDGHLNQHAVDDVMKTVAIRCARRWWGIGSGEE